MTSEATLGEERAGRTANGRFLGAKHGNVSHQSHPYSTGKDLHGHTELSGQTENVM